MTPLHDGSALLLGWRPPRGDWENYSVLLWNGSTVLANQTIGGRSQRHLFPAKHLLPGRAYRAEVVTHSGALRNEAHCYGRLGGFGFDL